YRRVAAGHPVRGRPEPDALHISGVMHQLRHRRPSPQARRRDRVGFRTERDAEADMDQITSAAEYLLELRRTREPVAALPPGIPPRAAAEGYQVRERLAPAPLAQSGGEPIGYKVACTSVAAQRALAVDGPFFGVLMSHSTHRSPATLDGSAFTVRCAEAEF